MQRRIGVLKSDATVECPIAGDATTFTPRRYVTLAEDRGLAQLAQPAFLVFASMNSLSF